MSLENFEERKEEMKKNIKEMRDANYNDWNNVIEKIDESTDDGDLILKLMQGHTEMDKKKKDMMEKVMKNNWNLLVPADEDKDGNSKTSGKN